MAPIPDTITTPTPKFRSFRQRRSTTGFSTISSQAMPPTIPTAASNAKSWMLGELNQSLSSPRSSMICSAPSPSAINASPP